MCGIAVVYARDRLERPPLQAIERMVDRQRARGPDRTAIVHGTRYHLGSNRLRIVDPRAAADQPAVRDDVHVLLNGEIFNHAELRAELPGPFATGGDTETVLHGYLAHGLGVLARLQGQFALAIVDERHDRLVLARDPLGICPLYYVEDRGVLYVASSMAALLAGVPGVTWAIDRDAVGEYLLLRYVLAPRTIIQQIRQVAPGEAIVLEATRWRAFHHWHVRGAASDPAQTAEQTQDLRATLDRAIAQNARCEVPLAAFLSGGLDSSIVVGVASRTHPALATLSIQLGDDDDGETAHAELAARAFGCQHAVYHAAPDDQLARGCLDAMDHPTGARDAVAMFALARALKRQRPATKVVLTGTGADELFAGYPSAYFGPSPGSVQAQCATYLQAYACTSPSGRRALDAAAIDALPVDRVASELAQRVARLHPTLDAADPVNVLCAFYLVSHLPGWELAVQDTMCMAASLEPRVPFLATQVVDAAMAIRGEHKLHPGREKAVLRDAFVELLPGAIHARRKMPLSRPVASWLSRHGVRDLYRSVRMRDRGIFHLDALSDPRTLEDFDVMWRVLALEWWLQRHLDGPRSST